MTSTVRTDIDISLSREARRKLRRELEGFHTHYELLCAYKKKLQEAAELAERLHEFERMDHDIQYLESIIKDTLHDEGDFHEDGGTTTFDAYKHGIEIPVTVVHEDERLNGRHRFQIEHYDLTRRFVVLVAYFGKRDGNWRETTLAIGFHFANNEMRVLKYDAAFDFNDPEGDRVPWTVLEVLHKEVGLGG